MPLIRVKSGQVTITGADLDGSDSAAIQAPFDDAPGKLTVIDSDLGATRFDVDGAVVDRGSAILVSSKPSNVGPDRATVVLQNVRFDKLVETAGGTSIRVGSSVVDQLTKTSVTFKAAQTGTPAQIVFEDWPTLISPRFRTSSIVAYRPATIDRAGFPIVAKFHASGLAYRAPTIDSVQPLVARFRTSTVATYRPTLTAVQIVLPRFRASTIVTRRPTLGAVQPITAKFRASAFTTYRPTLSAVQRVVAPFRFSTVRTFRPTMTQLQPIMVKFRPSTIRTFRPPAVDVLPVRARFRSSTINGFRPTISAYQPITAKFRSSSFSSYRPRVQSLADVAAKFHASTVQSFRPVLIVQVPLQLVIVSPTFRPSTIVTRRPSVSYYQAVLPRFRTSTVRDFRPTVTGGATGTDSDWFGPIVHEGQVEDAIVAQLKGWFPPTLAEIYRQSGLDDMRSRSAVTWQKWPINDKWDIRSLPTVLVAITGASDWRKGPETWDAKFTGEITVAVAAGTFDASRRLAQRTMAALRLGLTARSWRDGIGIEIVGSNVGTLGTPGGQSTRLVSLASVSVEVLVPDVQRRYSSLTTPPPTHTPAIPDQLAETVNVLVIPEED